MFEQIFVKAQRNRIAFRFFNLFTLTPFFAHPKCEKLCFHLVCTVTLAMQVSSWRLYTVTQFMAGLLSTLLKSALKFYVKYINQDS